LPGHDYSHSVFHADAPRLTSSPVGYVLIDSYQPASLACAASGSPAPSISWTKDGRQIEFSPQLHINGNGALVFSPARESDGGRYSCGAENSQGVHYMEFTLRVLHQLSLNSEPAIPPGEVAMTVMQDNDVVLNCDLPESSNVSEVLWRRGTGEGVCGEGVRVTANGSLMLTGVGVGHVGRYQCLAFLSQGRVREKITQLVVLPRKGKAWSQPRVRNERSWYYIMHTVWQSWFINVRQILFLPLSNEPCSDEQCSNEPCSDEPCSDEPCSNEPCSNEPCSNEPCSNEPCSNEPCLKRLIDLQL